jgi:hypothetical protein
MWQNNSSGMAAVHVVIIGFSREENLDSLLNLWTYSDIRGTPQLHQVKQINAYLVDAPEVIIDSRSKPINSEVSPMLKGSGPTDGGFLSDISAEAAEEIRKTDLVAAKYLRKFIGARELIHNDERWCLWLAEASPTDLRSSKVISMRLKEVRKMRLASKKKATQELASTPHLFEHNVQPKSEYIAVPRHSSEERKYVPIAYFDSTIIASDALSIIPDAPVWLFAILQSEVFNIWNKAISGRLESRVRISNTITYNNFPFPKLSAAEKKSLESSGMSIVQTRDEFPTASLADLYGQDSMPKDLQNAHAKNDEEVLKIFDLHLSSTSTEVLEKLFILYSKLISEEVLL